MSAPTVDLSQGTVEGTLASGIAAFKGIPYAAAPYGERRFQAPGPAPQWSGVHDGSKYGPTPPKGSYPHPNDELMPEPSIDGEEILNLNVWTPAEALASGNLPVFVWIHGGSFTNGTGAVSAYDGSRFARDGVVCVSINYRLGADGFLLIDGAPANRGLLDQVAALRWVQENISHFGGDPAAVTVGGESAGAMSVTALLTMPIAEGLFRSAITQSGAGHHTHSVQTAEKVTALMAQLLEVPATIEGFGSVPVTQLVRAASKAQAKIVTAANPAYWGELSGNGLPFEPVVDGEILPKPPIDALTAGIPVLAGTNTDEFALFMVPNGMAQYVTPVALGAMTAVLGLDPQVALPVYESARAGASAGEVLIAVLTDWFFRIPAVRLAQARGEGDTFMYEFSWRSPLYDGRLGAAHAVELGFVFDNLDDPDGKLLGENPPQSVADAMHRDWVAFICSGNPGWPAYGQARHVRVYDEKVEDVTDPRAAERELWDGVR